MEPLGAIGHFCTTGSPGALLAVGPYWSRGALGNPRTQGAIGVPMVGPSILGSKTDVKSLAPPQPVRPVRPLKKNTKKNTFF